MKYFQKLFFILIIASGCQQKEGNLRTRTETYSVDVSNIREDNSTSHGSLRTYNPSMMAIFPVDLKSPNKIAQSMSAESIFLVQTKSTCGEENGRVALQEDHPIVRASINSNELQVAQKDVAHIVGVTIEMPYVSKSYQGNSWVNKPEKLAVAFHIKNQGWVLHYDCIEPRLDDALQKGFAELQVDEANVDAIGILFHTMTYIDKIAYQVQETYVE